MQGLMNYRDQRFLIRPSCQRTKAGTFARHTKPTHKANLAKEPALFPRFLGQTQLRWTHTLKMTHPKEGRTYNMGFGVIGAGHC